MFINMLKKYTILGKNCVNEVQYTGDIEENPQEDHGKNRPIYTTFEINDAPGVFITIAGRRRFELMANLVSGRRKNKGSRRPFFC